MTIDEYLKQVRVLRHKYLRLYERARDAENKATRATSSLTSGGWVQNKSNGNATETRMIAASDAWGCMKAAYSEYSAFRDQLDESMDMLLYWEGRLIYQVYIYNTITEKEDDLEGVDEILNTKSKRVMLSKLHEAKMHLRTILIGKGVEIE